MRRRSMQGWKFFGFVGVAGGFAGALVLWLGLGSAEEQRLRARQRLAPGFAPPVDTNPQGRLDFERPLALSRSGDTERASQVLIGMERASATSWPRYRAFWLAMGEHFLGAEPGYIHPSAPTLYCDIRCGPDDAACRTACGLEVLAVEPHEEEAFWIALSGAAADGNEALYRDLLLAWDRTPPPDPRYHPGAQLDANQAWGRWLAGRAPRVQEGALSVLARAGLEDSQVALALGRTACRVQGADFVVCVP